ncbi:MAG: hypothetical protein QW207_03980 [Candidatus Micrarchaeaceae archaeon]
MATMKLWLLLAILSLTPIAANATSDGNLSSCVSCAYVSCPSNTTCGNAGTCANGNIFWACKYANGTPLVASPMKFTTTTATSTVTTTVPKPATTTLIATTTIIQAHVYPVGNPVLYIAVIVAVIAIIAAYYYFIKRAT